MKIAILGGAGAMGAMFGARLALAGEDVTLIDVNRNAIEHINQHGVMLEDKQGARQVVKAHANRMPGQMLTGELSPLEGALAAQWLGLIDAARASGARVTESIVMRAGDWIGVH